MLFISTTYYVDGGGATDSVMHSNQSLQDTSSSVMYREIGIYAAADFKVNVVQLRGNLQNI